MGRHTFESHIRNVQYDRTKRTVFARDYILCPAYPSRAMWHCVLTAGHVQTAPGWGIKQHSGCFLVQYVRHGKGWLRTRSHQFEVRAGELIFLDCHAPYELQADPNDPWELYWAAFDSVVAHHWIEALGCHSNPVLRPGHAARMLTQFQRLLSLVRRKPPGYEASVSALIHNLVAGLFVEQAKARRNGPNAAETNPLEDSSPGLPEPVRSAVARIRQAFFRHLSLEELVHNSGVSRSQLDRLFHKHLGVAPLDYLRQFRILHAKELLRNSQMSVKEISFHVGIEDVNYFSRLFRQRAGMTPKEYRAKTNRHLPLGGPVTA